MPILPTDLANLWGWYKAGNGVTGTSAVTAWADQSGNARDLTALSTHEGVLQTGIINGQPIIKQNASFITQFSTAVNFPDLSAGGTVYLVGSQSSANAGINFDSGGGFICAGNETNVLLKRGNLTGGLSVKGGMRTSIGTLIDLAIADDVFYTIRIRFDGTTMYMSINDGTETVLTAGSSSYAATPFTVFKGLGAAYGDKRIGEIIIYTENQDATKREQVEYYLQQKYNHFTWSNPIPPNLNSNTMATNEVQGDLIGVFLSSVLTTPAPTDFKEVLCNENLSLNGGRDVNKKRTKCGTVKGFGPPDWTVGLTGTYNTTPGTNKISAQELAAFFQNETQLLLKMVHATTSTIYTRIIIGQITKFTENANTGDAVSYDITFEGQGTVQLS